jgi:hypothetical protein
MARRKKLSDVDIEGLVSQELGAAEYGWQTERSDRNSRALEYYYGTMADTPSQPNRSAIVSRDVADTIDKLLPQIMRIFMASGTMFNFEPRGPEDEETAQQASDLVSHTFMNENDGYKLLYNATWDALTQGDGIVKVYWDSDYTEKRSETYTGLSEMVLADLLQDPDVEVVEQEQTDQIMDPLTGQPVSVFNVKVERIKAKGKVCIEVIPSEDFMANQDCTDLEDYRFNSHRDEVSKSELIEMGFDKRDVESLAAYSVNPDSEEENARQRYEYSHDNHRDDSTAKVELYECYIKADINGDGISEAARAYFAGNSGQGTLLDWEGWEAGDSPFYLIPCEPVPHQLFSLGLAEKVSDLQQQKTVMLRAAVDNQHSHNNPQPVVPVGMVINKDSITNPKFGQPILIAAKHNPADVLMWRDTPYIGDKIFGALEYFDKMIVERTGISNSAMALDPETLQNQSATAAQLSHDVQHSRSEQIARNMAAGWKRVGKAILKLLTQNQDRAKTVRLRGQWVDMDPRSWNADMDCEVNVGLGTGSRDRDMMMLGTVLQSQYALAAAGVQNGFPEVALEMLPKLVDTLTKQAEAAGIKNADQYYPEFTPDRLQKMAEQASQPQKDPKIALEEQKLQADVQLRQVELQLKKYEVDQKGAEIQAKSEADKYKQEMDYHLKSSLEREKLDANMMIERTQAEADLLIRQQEAQAEMQKMQAELVLKEREMMMKMELERQKAELMAKAKRTAKITRGPDGKAQSIEIGG